MEEEDKVAVMAHEGTFPILYNDHGLPAGAGMTKGYITRPDTRGTYPLVVLLGGLDGINPIIKDLARRLARHGYVVVVPNLYRFADRSPDSELPARITAYNEMSDRRALQDIDDAISWVIEDGAAFAADGPLAVVGLGVGGRLGLIYAARHQDAVAALAVAYAPLAGDEDRDFQVADALGMLPMAVLGIFGEADALVPVEGVDVAQSRNPHGQWLLYSGAGHDFLDDDSPEYDAGAAGDAFQRIIKLLGDNLPEPVRQR